MIVSIIIPMYKVASVLPRCISCLEAQIYTNLEIIFVDDCSPDDSALIVEQQRSKLEQRGAIVKLLRHQVNQGVAVARNTGLDNATGEYIYSFDADDYIKPNTIQTLVSTALNIHADVVGSDWVLCEANSRRYMSQPRVETGTEAFSLMCKGKMRWNLWLFLIKRSLIEDAEKLRFLKGKNMGEDMMFMGKVFQRAEKVIIIPQALYHYTKTNTGSLTANYTDQHWDQVDSNLRELLLYTTANGTEEQKREIEFLKLNLKLPLLISPKLSDYRKWESWFPEANPFIMFNDVQPLRTRILQLFAKYRLWVLIWLYYYVVMNFLYRLIYRK